MQFLKQSTGIDVRMGPFVDFEDGVTPETGVTLGGADQAELLKTNGAATVDISGATFAAVSGCDGYYDLTLTTSHTDTLGLLEVVIQDASVCLPVIARFMVIPADAYGAMVAGDDAMPSQVEGMDPDVVTATAVQNNAITSDKIAANAITATQINDGALTAAKLGADCITAAKIGDDAIAAEHIASAAIVAATFGAGAIDAAAIADAAIDNATFAADVGSTAYATNIIALAVRKVLDELHLDHLLAVDYDPASKPGVATALLNELVEDDSGVSRYTVNALENAPSGTGASAATIADAVWDEAQDDHKAKGTMGQRMYYPNSGDIVSATSTTAVLTTSSGVDEFYTDDYIVITLGTGAGQARLITAYDQATKTCTVSPAWATNPQSNSDYIILPFGEIAGASAPTAAAVADAVWDEAQADHVAAGSFGEEVQAHALSTELSTHDGKLDTVDTNVDAILVDTGTTLPASLATHDGKLDTVDTNVDAVLVDTGTTLPATLATAQADLDTLTGTDGATLATTQGNYAPAKAGDAMTLSDNAITAGKYDESTAFPLASADTGSTQIARTGADSDTLETLSDQIDGLGTASDKSLIVSTTIATLASQVSFTLTAGSTDDDAYNGCLCVVEDVSTAVQKAVGIISDYTGSTKTVTLLQDPGIFTMAATDKIDIVLSQMGRMIEDDAGDIRFTVNALEQGPSGSASNHYDTNGEANSDEDNLITWSAECKKNGAPQTAATNCVVQLYKHDGDGTRTEISGATETVALDDGSGKFNGSMTVDLTVGALYYFYVEITVDAAARPGFIPVGVPARTE